jgi:flagellar biosynthesis protein FlhF
MKIKRFLDVDSRRAMAQVRAQLGADAVILSNKRVDGQVEIVAAMDFDAGAFASSENILPSESTGSSVSKEIDSPTLTDLQRELSNLRSMLEGKLSHLSWRDTAGKPSPKAALHTRLVRLGLSRALCGVICDMLPAQDDLEQYWQSALKMLASRIAVMEADSLINNGGIVALMGSTGVGKTTTVAKLAARFVLRHGCKEVALITTDCYRIGGQEQLQTFAEYLGIPMVVATDGPQLQSALDQLSPRKLILIDTAGMSQRDLRLYEQFSTLNSVGYDIDTYVVLSATAQHRALHEVVDVFGKNALAGAMVTKVDESVGLGGVLDVVIKNRLSLGYVSQGQKVPEDLIPARVEYMIDKAVELMDQEITAATKHENNSRPNQPAMARN